MKLGQAIDSVLFKNYFNLEGKATRSEYWWFMLFYPFFSFVVGFIVGELAITLGADFNQDTFSLYLTLGLLALLILPLLGLSVRRFADAGRGKREAIIVFVLVLISQLTVPLSPQGAAIEIVEFLDVPALIVFGISHLYTLYIALKKSV
jgi:uncharacterized membrane protein YhaH (DUF805 family)